VFLFPFLNQIACIGEVGCNFAYLLAYSTYIVSIACIGAVGCNLFSGSTALWLKSFNRLHWRGRLQLLTFFFVFSLKISFQSPALAR